MSQNNVTQQTILNDRDDELCEKTGSPLEGIQVVVTFVRLLCGITCPIAVCATKLRSTPRSSIVAR